MTRIRIKTWDTPAHLLGKPPTERPPIDGNAQWVASLPGGSYEIDEDGRVTKGGEHVLTLPKGPEYRARDAGDMLHLYSLPKGQPHRVFLNANDSPKSKVRLAAVAACDRGRRITMSAGDMRDRIRTINANNRAHYGRH